MGLSIFGIQIGAPTEPGRPTSVGRYDSGPQYGIPLTVAEAGRLADSLALVDRLSYAAELGRRPGVKWARSLANEVAGYAGGAEFRGYAHVPFPLAQLGMVDRALELGMEMGAGGDDMIAFEDLVRRMHVLAGMAKVAGWVLNPAADGAAWLNEEPSRPLLARGEDPVS